MGPGRNFAPVLLVFAMHTACRGTAVTPNAQDIVVMDVAAARVPCMGIIPMQCLRVRFLPDTTWSNFSSQIIGFDYEEGFEWRIEVQRTPLVDPPADGSSVQYTLRHVIRKSKVQDSGL